MLQSWGIQNYKQTLLEKKTFKGTDFNKIVGWSWKWEVMFSEIGFTSSWFIQVWAKSLTTDCALFMVNIQYQPQLDIAQALGMFIWDIHVELQIWIWSRFIFSLLIFVFIIDLEVPQLISSLCWRYNSQPVT